MQNSEQSVGKLSQVKLKKQDLFEIFQYNFCGSFLLLFHSGLEPAVAELLKQTIGVLIQCGKKSRIYTVLQNKQNDKHQIIHYI